MNTRYKIIKSDAGSGGFGKISEAMDSILERRVAIKTLDPIFKIEPSAKDIERFMREAKTLASLSHPNIPAIYDIRLNQESNEFSIIFEWIDGINFRESLQNRGLMSLKDVTGWFYGICTALEHTHIRGIIHRDIKPSNIILSQNSNTCILVDFGISLKSDEIERLSQGTPIGTPGYMSPEQEAGEEIDKRSDIFSLGIVLYECLAGNKPTIGEYRPLNTYNEAIPPAIDKLIQACLKDKSERLESASAFFDQLNIAVRPHESFTKVLSEGALHEIQLSISKMRPEEYASLPKGQRRLVMTRVKDLINVDEENMRNAVASLISELIFVAFESEETDYSFITDSSIQYGYEMKYGHKWLGNSQVREKLNEVAKICYNKAHKIITDSVLKYIKDINDLETKDRWYFHDLRILLQNLLANPHCSDEHVDPIGDLLENINALSHKTN